MNKLLDKMAMKARPFEKREVVFLVIIITLLITLMYTSFKGIHYFDLGKQVAHEYMELENKYNEVVEKHNTLVDEYKGVYRHNTELINQKIKSDELINKLINEIEHTKYKEN